jgi:hypothetical protein
VSAKSFYTVAKGIWQSVCAKYGIYAASTMLRHSNIAITADHYLESKERVTFGRGNLLRMPKNRRP